MPPKIDSNLCIGCGTCSIHCGRNVFVMLLEKKISDPINAIDCLECFMCYDLCPTGAISMNEPFCKAACPLGMDIPGYIDLISQRRYIDAYKLMKKYTPLPGVLGYICHHPCELTCRRKDIDEQIAIRYLKRFIADCRLTTKEQTSSCIKFQPDGKNIAVVGSGPAGLSAAYFLRKLGYNVTIFEALSVIGGMMATVIPKYRLPSEVLQYEIDSVKRLGISFITNTMVGRDITFEQLKKDGYGAIFLALGTHKRGNIGIPDENLSGIINAIDFLKKIEIEQNNALAGQVVTVIGAGKVGIDAACSARRLGAQKVQVVDVRNRTDLADCKESIEEAEAEGIKFHWLLMPKKFLGDEGRVNGIECQEMALGKFSRGELRELVAQENAIRFRSNIFIIAIGQVPDLRYLSSIEHTNEGMIIIDDKSFQTNIEGVFAGGDCVTGTSSVVEAMAMGKKAAFEINRYLGKNDSGDEVDVVDRVGIPQNIGQYNSREDMPEITIKERIKSFCVYELGFSEDQAIREASRCSRCGKIVLR